MKHKRLSVKRYLMVEILALAIEACQDGMGRNVGNPNEGVYLWYKTQLKHLRNFKRKRKL